MTSIDLEDIGGELALLLDQLCNAENVMMVGKAVGLKVSGLFGAKKNKSLLRTELSIITSAIIIDAVNRVYDEANSKVIIDEFLGQAKVYVFEERARSDSKFPEKYSKRLADYFQIFPQEKAILGLSFSLLRNLGLSKNFKNLEAQLFLAEFIGLITQRSLEVLGVETSENQPDAEKTTPSPQLALLEEFKEEISDWPADKAKIALEVLVSIIEGDEDKYEQLYPQLTFSQFETVAEHIKKLDGLASESEADIGEEEDGPRPFPLQELPPEYDTYHDVLDEIVDMYTVPMSSLCTEDDEANISAKCELLSYGAVYYAKLFMKVDLHPASWNSFASSVENRILAVLDEKRPPAKGETLPGGGTRITHYASKYRKQLSDIEEIIDQDPNPGMPKLEPLLEYLSISLDEVSPEIMKDFDRTFAKTVGRSARLVLPDVMSAFA